MKINEFDSFLISSLDCNKEVQLHKYVYINSTTFKRLLSAKKLNWKENIYFTETDFMYKLLLKIPGIFHTVNTGTLYNTITVLDIYPSNLKKQLITKILNLNFKVNRWYISILPNLLKYMKRK